MSKKGALHILIKSLTKAEKRNFKLFAAMSGSNKNYVQLFDFIEKQEEYDETAVKKHFKGQRFIVQLHVTKNYLNKLILKSLRNYHSKISKDAELKELLRDAEILFRKELYDQCNYTILKAENIARQYEKNNAMLEILAWKRKLLMTRKGAPAVTEEVVEIIEQERSALSHLNNIVSYWDLTFSLFKEGFGKAKIDAVLDHPLMETSELASTLQAKTLYHHIRYVGGTIGQRPDIGESSMLELIEMMEQQPHRIEEDSVSYIAALNNLLSMHLHRNEFDAVTPILEKLRSIPTRYKLAQSEKLKVQLFIRTYNVELELYRDTGRFEEALPIIAKVQSFLQPGKHTVNEQYVLSFYFQFSYIFFKLGRFKESMRWINLILNKNYGTLREDVQSYTRILNLIIHLELNNIFVLKYAVDSTRRFLKKKRSLHAFESVLLRFFSKISMTEKAKHASLFQQLYSDLFEGEEAIMTANHLDYLDIKTWCADKLATCAK